MKTDKTTNLRADSEMKQDTMETKAMKFLLWFIVCVSMPMSLFFICYGSKVKINQSQRERVQVP